VRWWGVPVGLVLSFALILFVGANAFAAPEEEDQRGNVTIEYHYAEGGSPTIAQTITQFGRTYTLVNTAAPVLESSLPRVRTYNYEISGALLPEDLALAEQYPNISLTPVEVAKERSVDKTDVLRGLPNNDVDYLPYSREFQVSSAAGPQAVTLEELALAGVTYTVEGYDDDGLPASYQADIVYRGVETYKELGYYEAQATYTTEEVEGSVDYYVVVATYAPVSTGSSVGASGDQSSQQGRQSGTTSAGSSLDAIDNSAGNAQQSDDLVGISDEQTPLVNGSTSDGSGFWNPASASVVALIVLAPILVGILILRRIGQKRRASHRRESH
jgi:hypothetical protein